MLKIIGGNAKGRRIGLKKSFSKKDACPLRPTSAKVRKAIFDIIQDRICNASFLDLYAGSGAVGIEALSRGSSRVVFVDASPLRGRAIKEMLQDIGFGDRAQVFRGSAKSFIEKLSNMEEKYFDIIFADPPYGSQELDEIIPLLDKKDIISDNGILIVEHSSKRPAMPAMIGNLRLLKQYKYGDTKLSLYMKSGSVGSDKKYNKNGAVL